MNALIIGCGYLGMRVARAWLPRYHSVFALTRTSENANTMRALGIQPIVGDVTNPGSLRELPHVQTALYAVGFDRTTPQSMRDVYVDGLRNVLDVLAAHVERFIYISSTSVYGQSGGEWVDETSDCQPTRENGQICLEAEHLVWHYFSRAAASRSSPGHQDCQSKTRRIDQFESSEPVAGNTSGGQMNVLRLAGIYGPQRLIARVEELRKGTPIGGNPKAWLNLIHVDDAVQAILACENKGQPGELYLVCDNAPVRRCDYYESLASHLGVATPTFAADESQDKILPSFNKRCSNKKLQMRLGVNLRFSSCREGIQHVLRDDGVIS